MGVQIGAHVVALHLHVVAHLVEARGADHVTLAIDLPGDGRVLRAHLIAASVSGGGSGVDVNVLAHVLVDDHAANHARVEVGFVVDDCEYLSVHPNGVRDILCGEFNEAFEGEVAEHAIVEGSLILVDGAAGTCGGVRPVHLVGLADLYTLAVLPVVGRRELGISSIVVVAAKAILNLFVFRPRSILREIAIGPLGSRNVAMGAVAVLIELAVGVVLEPQMPVHIDGAHAALPVGLGVREEPAHVQITDVSHGDVRTGLGHGDLEVGAKLVFECQLCPRTYVVLLGRKEEGRGLALEEFGAGRHGGSGLFTGRGYLVRRKSDGRCEKSDGGKAEKANEKHVHGRGRGYWGIWRWTLQCNSFLDGSSDGIFGRRAHGLDKFPQ